MVKKELRKGIEEKHPLEKEENQDQAVFQKPSEGSTANVVESRDGPMGLDNMEAAGDLDKSR